MLSKAQHRTLQAILQILNAQPTVFFAGKKSETQTPQIGMDVWQFPTFCTLLKNPKSLGNIPYMECLGK